MGQLRQADPEELGVIRSLWVDYLTWVNGELDRRYGINFAIAEIIERNLADLTPFQPPRGRLLLIGEVGIGCLQPIGEDIGEIKRMYVHPDARGAGLGRRLLDGLLAAATDVGYRRVLLDSVRFMESAHALYRSAGFTEIEPYEQSEIPPEYWEHWVFMERTHQR
jgi:GNAT superfamily N-acetyltransferase